ncbi:unnamed protein product [Leptosia nina]|uniref:Uncharacterized protein n=1 Tax=Leptosia nina TaxID=320188 RepID=A0AAV1IXI2_9NEOP
MKSRPTRDRLVLVKVMSAVKTGRCVQLSKSKIRGSRTRLRADLPLSRIMSQCWHFVLALNNDKQPLGFPLSATVEKPRSSSSDGSHSHNREPSVRQNTARTAQRRVRLLCSGFKEGPPPAGNSLAE